MFKLLILYTGEEGSALAIASFDDVKEADRAADAAERDGYTVTKLYE